MRRVAALAAAVLLLVLTACSGMPTSGQVYPGNEPLGVEEEPGVAFAPDGPQAGASPQQIVDGFLRAGSGPQESWATAREFLTPDLANSWRPRDSVTIDRLADRSTAVTAETDDVAAVSASVSSTGVLDATGVYTPQSGSSELPYELERVDGEWRISAAPDGIVLFEEVFRTVFEPASLYYFDLEWEHLVPDVRWYPTAYAATWAVTALVGELPSAWLVGAVQSAFPEGIGPVGGVGPSGGLAEVELEEEALTLDSQTLGRMQAQLDATIRSVDRVGARMTVDGSPLQAVPAAVRATRVDTRSLVQTDDGRFGFLDEDEVEPLGELSAAIEALGLVTAVETSAGQDFAAVRSAAGSVLRAADDGTSVLLDSRPGLVAPSIDTFGAVWSVPESSPQAVRVFELDGTSADVSGAWPDAADITAMQVSRDGARVAALVSTGGRSEVWVAGIRRPDGQAPELGVPFVLTSGLGEGLALAWLDDTTLGVLDRTSGELRLREQPVGGPGTDLTVPAGAADVVGGNSSPRLLTEDGAVYVRQTTIWRELATGVNVLAAQQGLPE